MYILLLSVFWSNFSASQWVLYEDTSDTNVLKFKRTRWQKKKMRDFFFVAGTHCCQKTHKYQI